MTRPYEVCTPRATTASSRSSTASDSTSGRVHTDLSPTGYPLPRLGCGLSTPDNPTTYPARKQPHNSKGRPIS
jgi:hypothetical protein